MRYRCIAGFANYKIGDIIGEVEYETIPAGARALFLLDFLSPDKAPTPAPKKPEVVKSHVARFPLVETTNCGSITAKEPLAHARGYRYKALAKRITDDRLKIIVHGGGSAAMAAVEAGWYMKTGCCASITSSGSNTRLVYFIPHVGPMSIGKKIAYIRELEKILPRKVRFLGVHVGPLVKHPLGFNDGVEQRMQLNGGAEVLSEPRSFVAADKYIMVYGKVGSNGMDRLLLLQFLRPLYQTIQNTAYATYSAFPNGTESITYEYYQPRLYMRLKRWFPKLTIYQLMYLSFTIHGVVINQTYFPYYQFHNGYRASFDPSRSYSSINLLVASSGAVRDYPRVNQAVINSVRDGTFKLSDLQNMGDATNYVRLFEKLFLKNTRESYRHLINVIGWCIKDKTLMETV